MKVANASRRSPAATRPAPLVARRSRRAAPCLAVRHAPLAACETRATSRIRTRATKRTLTPFSAFLTHVGTAAIPLI
ncbi:hypothetical protein A8H31_08565 [Burkholderia thailandensis]|nr:hypothetical protein WJ27_28560 [Burkholderia thailandensis]AVR07521.1 hypothetical protein A8H31_08565 [Burkholderia thailandensis]KVG06457.1 hypothetical protein WJ25_16805 [Burkholderia thailandensis]KVG21770.1 hypothetical protein WJ28_02515 [Burkholderia thailandensis]NOK44059.1 hypothetical protein [Burkholderia thailandensis]